MAQARALSYNCYQPCNQGNYIIIFAQCKYYQFDCSMTWAILWYSYYDIIRLVWYHINHTIVCIRDQAPNSYDQPYHCSQAHTLRDNHDITIIMASAWGVYCLLITILRVYVIVITVFISIFIILFHHIVSSYCWLCDIQQYYYNYSAIIAKRASAAI